MENQKGYIYFRKCRKQTTYSDNLQILYQGRQDNPLHEVAYILWSNTMLDCERSVTRTLFMDENSDRSH